MTKQKPRSRTLSLGLPNVIVRAARNLLSAIDDAIDRIETFPASGAPIPLGCRALTLSSYPYRVIYQDSDGEVLIVALANTSRRSTYWRDRLPRP